MGERRKSEKSFIILSNFSASMGSRVDGGSQKVREGLKSCQNLQTSNNMWSNLLHIKSSATKGQLISKCLFGVIFGPKHQQKRLTYFFPRIWKINTMI